MVDRPDPERTACSSHALLRAEFQDVEDVTGQSDQPRESGELRAVPSQPPADPPVFAAYADQYADEEAAMGDGNSGHVVSLEDVRRHRAQILAIGERYGVRNVRVFGSVARGEADAASDLDLLIDVDPGRGYFDMAGFALDVEDLLGVFTQVATVGGLKLRIRQRVLDEAVAV